MWNSVYENKDGLLEQESTGYRFDVVVKPDCAEVIFQVARTDVVIDRFPSAEEAHRAYESVVRYAATVNDVFEMIREKARMVKP